MCSGHILDSLHARGGSTGAGRRPLIGGPDRCRLVGRPGRGSPLAGDNLERREYKNRLKFGREASNLLLLPQCLRVLTDVDKGEGRKRRGTATEKKIISRDTRRFSRRAYLTT
jgi:hypothetical protein